MADHDQRFKALLQEFFAEFVRLFLPEWAERFDLEHVKWLSVEAFPDPPQGERRQFDLVAEIRTLQPVPAAPGAEGGEMIALLRVEIESGEGVAAVRPRMFDYYWMLQARYRVPVLPIGLYLRVGLQGLGWDTYERWFWERRLVHFEYPYIGLPALDAEQYVNGDNVLGMALAALMRVPPDRRAWLKAEALRRLVACQEKPLRRFLLCECVQAYLPLEGPQLEEFDRLLLSEPYEGVPPMATTWFEQGQIRALVILLEKRLGRFSPEVRARLEALSTPQLDELSEKLLDAKSLNELGLGEDKPT